MRGLDVLELQVKRRVDLETEVPDLEIVEGRVNFPPREVRHERKQQHEWER